MQKGAVSFLVRNFFRAVDKASPVIMPDVVGFDSAVP